MGYKHQFEIISMQYFMKKHMKSLLFARFMSICTQHFCGIICRAIQESDLNKDSFFLSIERRSRKIQQASKKVIPPFTSK